jgi:ribose-phosphate pyrophosphokinase
MSTRVESSITLTPQKRLLFSAGRSHPELAEQVASKLGTELSPVSARDFANGEIFVRFEESVRGCDVFILQSHTTPINHWMMEQLIMVDAAKRASAKRITVVAPFLGYARQDKKHRGREPISARLMMDMFAAAGADRFMTLDLHTSQIQGFFDGPVDHLFALPLLTNYIADRYADQPITVVSPDAGRVRVAERWTDVLGAPLAIIHKRRDPDVPNEVKVFEVVGDVRDRLCVVVDDMIDTGGTIAKAAETLFENGASDVVVAATHGILSDPAKERLAESGIVEVLVTDTLPIAEEKRFEQLTVLSVAPLLARAIKEVFSDGSVTSIFEPHTGQGA